MCGIVGYTGGRRVVPVLLEGLRSEHSLDRSNAAYGIGDLGEAAYAIGHLGETGSPALEALENLMWDECVSVQLHAASAISKITGDP